MAQGRSPNQETPSVVKADISGGLFATANSDARRICQEDPTLSASRRQGLQLSASPLKLSPLKLSQFWLSQFWLSLQGLAGATYRRIFARRVCVRSISTSRSEYVKFIGRPSLLMMQSCPRLFPYRLVKSRTRMYRRSSGKSRKYP